MVTTPLRPARATTLDSALSRRGFLGGLGIVAAAGVAACASPAAPSTGAGATRTLQTAAGEVVVPADPRRVACLDPGFSWQTLLEVGLTPVGLPMVVESLVRPENLAAARGIPSLATAGGDVDLEKVAQVTPDLILATSGPAFDAIRDRLTAIAPVAAYAFDYPSDWIDLDRSYADAVNRADRLAGVVAQYDQQVAQLKDQHGDVVAAHRWALVTESADQVYVWGSRSSAGPVLAAAGAGFSAGAPDDTTPYTALSLENIGSLADATVILYGATPAGQPYADTATLLTHPLFTALPAARAGHVYPLPSWFAYCHQDAIAQVAGLADACRRIAGG